jgi:hypothetical protein
MAPGGGSVPAAVISFGATAVRSPRATVEGGKRMVIRAGTEIDTPSDPRTRTCTSVLGAVPARMAVDWVGPTVVPMERDDRPRVPDEPVAVRDAGEILARALADEAAADLARARYRTQPIATLAPDERIGPLLVPDERVVAIRRSALLERRQPMPGARATRGLAGTLYVTSRRIVLLGRASLSFGLGAIQEVMVSGDRLLVVLRDGQGFTLEVQQPRVLRVELAAARAAQTAGERVGEDRAPAR